MPIHVSTTRTLKLTETADGVLDICQGSGALLLRYVYKPSTPRDESPRPYVHPLSTLSGECLTNLRPNDHRWHHGLSYTITTLNGSNFWGGPTYKKDQGYLFNTNHGFQKHVSWIEQNAYHLSHLIHWVGSSGILFLIEERSLVLTLISDLSWCLRWKSSFKNVSGTQLLLGNYYSSANLKGSHYSGLQFRGARDLLDEHGDDSITVNADGGLNGEDAIHSRSVKWVEWQCQKDSTQRRVQIRFEDNLRPFPAFIRKSQPLMAIPFQYDKDICMDINNTFEIDNTLTFTDL